MYTHKIIKQWIGYHGELQKIGGSTRDGTCSINDKLEKSRRKYITESMVDLWKVLNYSLEVRDMFLGQ